MICQQADRIIRYDDMFTGHSGPQYEINFGATTLQLQRQLHRTDILH